MGVSIYNFIFPIFPNNTVAHILIYIACAGGLGGTVAAMTAFCEHQPDFKPSYANWYYYRPILGMIMGVFVFILFTAGLFGVQKNLPSNVVSYYIAISFLAGFAVRQTTKKLYELASTLFSEKSQVVVFIKAKQTF